MGDTGFKFRWRDTCDISKPSVQLWRWLPTVSLDKCLTGLIDNALTSGYRYVFIIYSCSKTGHAIFDSLILSLTDTDLTHRISIFVRTHKHNYDSMLKYTPVWQPKLVPAVWLTHQYKNINLKLASYSMIIILFVSSHKLQQLNQSEPVSSQIFWLHAVRSDHSSCTSLSQHGNHTQKVSTCFFNMEPGTSLRSFNELPEASCSFTCQLHPNYSWSSLLWRYYAKVIIKWRAASLNKLRVCCMMLQDFIST